MEFLEYSSTMLSSCPAAPRPLLLLLLKLFGSLPFNPKVLEPAPVPVPSSLVMLISSLNVKPNNFLAGKKSQISSTPPMRFRYAMVCSSNQNRSMEAHALLKRQGLDVASYGTGSHVKLPGPSLREPNVYDFGTPYKQMFDELRRKDPELYKRNGILQMIKRNLSVKLAPQRWQDNAGDGVFDVVMTFEEKVFDSVLEDLNNREQSLTKTILVMNLEVKDNHEEAAIGGRLALELCQEIEGNETWEDTIDDIVAGFEKQHRRKLVYSISFY
ncbi:hypothetical protein AXX17_AT1G68100 [Arabidopsis thaliana]|uniref:RNA polymerase II subunit A C-terminal domain phosphatase SSU72 n=5 Tax=Arabidopsis TaxID=3701 RepID=A0A178WB13_ARATH|nr:hypothetical protein AXX17_AT1G68100 [Arabidopsis thaliana]